MEVVGVTRELTETLAERLRVQFGIERSRFMIVASHTHSGPTLHASIGGQLTLSPQETAVIQRHTEKIREQVFEAVSEALGKLQPARLSFGQGKAGFAMNRRIFSPTGVRFGANPDGLVDHSVPVLRAETAEGEVPFSLAMPATVQPWAASTIKWAAIGRVMRRSIWRKLIREPRLFLLPVVEVMLTLTRAARRLMLPNMVWKWQEPSLLCSAGD